MEWQDSAAAVLAWLGEHSGALLLGSLAVLALAVLVLPMMLARIPADYFLTPGRPEPEVRERHPLVALLLVSIKNCLGALLVALGLVMLFTPGQGLLTLFAGLMLMNYPGKFALERWLVRRPGVLPAINWVRSRSGQPPLIPPEQP